MDTPGGRLRAERIRLGYTQEEFGALGGVRKQAQIKYEKGDRKPDAKYFAGIAAKGADVAFILTGETAALRATLDVIRGATQDASKVPGTAAERAAIRDADAMLRLNARLPLTREEAALVADFRACGTEDQAAITRHAAALAAAARARADATPPAPKRRARASQPDK